MFKIFFYLFLFFIFFKTLHKRESLFKLKLNLSTFFCVSLFLYTFLVIVENEILYPTNLQAIEFYWQVIVLLFALIIGVLSSNILVNIFPKKHIKSSHEIYPKKINNIKFYIVTVIVLLIFILFINLIYGGFIVFFNQTYGDYQEGNMNSFSAIIPLIICSYILFFNLNSSLYLTSKQNRIVIFLSLFFILIFMFGGNRNLSVMMAISLFYSKFYNYRINIVKYIPIIAIVILFSSIVAVGRQYGLINYITNPKVIENSDFWRYALNFSGSEFGTMYRLLNYSQEFTFNPPNFNLYSYIISPVEQLIPTFIFPSREHSIAVEFTKQYSGGLGKGTIGLGFSPIVEAKISLNEFWPLLFIVFGFLINYFKIILKNTNFHIAIGAFSAVSLNFFRIDFALFIKFFLLILFFSLSMKKYILK